MVFFQADPPNAARIPREDVVGVTVVLLTCSYRQQEFIRVGYYVNNEYVDPEIRENPPQEPDFDKVLSALCSFSSNVSILRNIRVLLVSAILRHTHTHTHNCFTALLEFVWDYPGEQVPEM